jgi:hypothetical protein
MTQPEPTPEPTPTTPQPEPTPEPTPEPAEQLPPPDPTHAEFERVDEVASPEDDSKTVLVVGLLGIGAALFGLHHAAKKGWL